MAINREAEYLRTIRILLVEDHHIVRKAVASLLSRQQLFEIVGEIAEGGDTLFEAVARLQPDLLLLDALLPGYDLIQDVTELYRRNPNVRILILSASERNDIIYGLLKAGAQGYMNKADPAHALPNAIRIVANGGRWVSPKMVDLFLESTQAQSQEPDMILTPRELDVLVVLAKGNSNVEIGDELLISEQTVKNHVYSIFKKLGVNTRLEAVLYALNHGLAPANIGSSQ
jgi:DNA-binding NarL/FixJ family response regulator